MFVRFALFKNPLCSTRHNAYITVYVVYKGSIIYPHQTELHGEMEIVDIVITNSPAGLKLSCANYPVYGLCTNQTLGFKSLRFCFLGSIEQKNPFHKNGLHKNRQVLPPFFLAVRKFKEVACKSFFFM